MTAAMRRAIATIVRIRRSAQPRTTFQEVVPAKSRLAASTIPTAMTNVNKEQAHQAILTTALALADVVANIVTRPTPGVFGWISAARLTSQVVTQTQC
jgi:hypothetical protein